MQLKRFIRLDQHFERLRIGGWLRRTRKRWKIPLEGFTSVEGWMRWQKDNLWSNRDNQEKWQKTLQRGLKLAKLPKDYISNIEMLVALDFLGVWDVNQPGISHHRTDRSYLKAKKLTEFYKGNTSTGKKRTAGGVAEAYQPNPESPRWKSPEKYDEWQDKYGLTSGELVRKIISRHRKRYSK